MKTLIAFLLTMTLNAEAQHHHHDRPSVHGMLMMGHQTVYLSHLPMFHAPHDYQAIFEAKLDPESERLFHEAQKAHPEVTVFTLVPEAFVLPDMAAKPRPFKAQIYLGHFERGGTLLKSKVTVTLTQVLYFKKFVPGAKQGKGQLLFGSESELFLAHQIEAKPDFDQIVELPVEAQYIKILQGKPLQVTSGIDPDLGQELYLEFDDLSL